MQPTLLGGATAGNLRSMRTTMAVSLLLLGVLLPSAAAITLRGVTWPAGTWAEKKCVAWSLFAHPDVNTLHVHACSDLRGQAC